jgi:hypothetical protein
LCFGLLRQCGCERGGHGSAGRTSADEKSPARNGVFGHEHPPPNAMLGCEAPLYAQHGILGFDRS